MREPRTDRLTCRSHNYTRPSTCVTTGSWPGSRSKAYCKHMEGRHTRNQSWKTSLLTVISMLSWGGWTQTEMKSSHSLTSSQAYCPTSSTASWKRDRRRIKSWAKRSEIGRNLWIVKERASISRCQEQSQHPQHREESRLADSQTSGKRTELCYRTMTLMKKSMWDLDLTGARDEKVHANLRRRISQMHQKQSCSLNKTQLSTSISHLQKANYCPTYLAETTS